MDGLHFEPHEAIEESGFNVNRFPKLHTVKRRQNDGSFRLHVYAWRGGPKIGTDEPADVIAARQSEAVARFGGSAIRVKPPRDMTRTRRVFAMRRYVGKALQNARARAAKKKVNFTIDVDVILSLLTKQAGRCALSGIEFKPDYDGAGGFSYNPYGISLDRIDCRLGYTRANVRLVLTAINFALNEWGEDIYMHIARNVVAKSLTAGVLGGNDG